MPNYSAVVSGAAQGLGYAIARRLEADGHSVLNLPGDIIDAGKMSIDEYLSWHISDDRPMVVVNNYATHHLSWIGSTPAEDEKIMLVNVMGPYWVVNWFRSGTKSAHRVLNIASQTYRVNQRCSTLYSASKAALVQMTKVMARELAPYGWVINALAPGKIVGTSMTEKVDAQVNELRGWTNEQAEAYALQMIPMERFTYPSEVADAAIQVLNLPSYVNGTVIDMTGGV